MPFACARLGLLATAGMLTAAQDVCSGGLATCGDPSALERAALRQDVADGDSAVGLIQYSRGKAPQADPSALKEVDGVPSTQVEGDASGLVEEGRGDASLAQKRSSGPFDNITDAFGDVVGKINDTVDKAVTAINDTLHDALDNLTGDASGLLEEGRGDASLAQERSSGPFDNLTDAITDVVGKINNTGNKTVTATNDTLHDAVDNLTGDASGLLEEGRGDASLAQERSSGPFDNLTDAFGDVVGKINNTGNKTVTATNDTLHDAVDNLTGDASGLLEEGRGDASLAQERSSGPFDNLTDAFGDVVGKINNTGNKTVTATNDTLHDAVDNLTGNDGGALEGNVQEGSLLQTRTSDPLDDLVDGLQGIVDELNKTVQTAISNISDTMQDALDNLSGSTTDIYYTPTDYWAVPTMEPANHMLGGAGDGS